MKARSFCWWVTVVGVILLSACTNPFSSGSDGSDGSSEPDTTPPGAGEPAAPGLLLPADGAADTGNLVTLEWEASAGATSYDVYFGTDSPPAALAAGGEAITSTELAVSGLSYDTTYSWFVRAKNAEGSADSAVRSFSTGAAPTSPPGQASAPTPADGAVGVTPDSILQWAAADGAESYNIYLGIDLVPGSATATGVTATSYDPPGDLILEADYYWRVDAVNTQGTTTGTEWSFTVADAASLAPDAPTGVTATVSATSGSNTIDLTWTDNSTDETGLEIERSDNGGTSWSAVTATAADATSYSDSGLQPDTTYRFRVRAINDYAESSWAGNNGAATATTDVSPYVYVSWNGGNDTTGSGTASNPYASVTKGLAEATAGQTIRVAGTNESEEYSEAPMLWKAQVSLEGGWSPDLSTHAPSTYETVIRADISSGTEHLIQIDFVIGPINISHVTLINHSTTNNQDPVVWISGSGGDITLDTVVVEADGPVSASAVRTEGGADVVIRNSTIRTLSIPTDGSSNWAYGVVADSIFGSLTIENTDITVNAAYIAAAVKQESGDLTITGGSLTNAMTTEGASRGAWVFSGNTLSMDGVTVTTSDSNTSNSEGVVTQSVQTSLRVLNSDLTIGASSGGSSRKALGLVTGEASDEITIRGNTFRFNSAQAGNSGDFIGIEIDGTTGGSILRIDRNTISFGPDADGTEITALYIRDTTSGAANVADPLEVTNNLIYREDGNDAYFYGINTFLTNGTTGAAVFFANNTIVSLDTGNSTGMMGIARRTGQGTEIVNNIILTGQETNERYGVWKPGGDLPSRVESNYIAAQYLFDGRTAIADVNDATLVTHDTDSDGDGDGIATGNVTALTTAFADPTSGDFDLTASSASALRTGGADLSAVFDSDIEGVTRSTGGNNGSDWSIGAFEY